MPDGTGADEELRQYEPIYSGPPEKPEYYMLAKKKGVRELTGLKINSRIVEDKARLERHEALSKLRKQYFGEKYPELIPAGGLPNDPLMWSAGFPIPVEYMPSFEVYKNDIPPKEPIVLVHVPAGRAQSQHTVSSEWKNIIEETAPGECQFLPFEFRHKDGSLIRTRYIIRCLADDPGLALSPKKSGLRSARAASGGIYWAKNGPGKKYEDKLYDGQLVLCRSAVRGWNIAYCGSDYFVSARLHERLKDHCGRHYAFYPLHIDEEC